MVDTQGIIQALILIHLEIIYSLNTWLIQVNADVQGKSFFNTCPDGIMTRLVYCEPVDGISGLKQYAADFV